jgi:hypothetical protein
VLGLKVPCKIYVGDPTAVNIELAELDTGWNGRVEAALGSLDEFFHRPLRLLYEGSCPRNRPLFLLKLIRTRSGEEEANRPGCCIDSIAVFDGRDVRHRSRNMRRPGSTKEKPDHPGPQDQQEQAQETP